MKKILILNLLAAGFLAGSAPACEPPYSRAAIAQLGQAAGSDYGDCPQAGDEDFAILPPVVPEFPMPETPSQPQYELMPCYWFPDGICAPGMPVPFFPGSGETYCDETVPPVCLGDSALLCFPPCVVGGVYNGPIVYESFRGKNGAREELRQAYLGQPAAKAMVAERMFKGNAAAKAGLLADKSIKVISDGKSVTLIAGGRTVTINDPALAARVYAAIYPSLGERKTPENKIIFNPVVAGTLACMADDSCWNAVGDLVSAASQDIATHYYSN